MCDHEKDKHCAEQIRLLRIRKRRYPKPREWSTSIHADGVVLLPPGLVSWKIGPRIYLRNSLYLSVQVGSNPKGSILNGYSQCARIRKMGHITKAAKTVSKPL